MAKYTDRKEGDIVKITGNVTESGKRGQITGFQNNYIFVVFSNGIERIYHESDVSPTVRRPNP